jgi:transcriptional antiterminator
MKSLNSRTRDILQILVEAEQPLTAKELAVQTRLTEREVHYWIQKADVWLADRKTIIEKKTGLEFL